MWQVLLAAAVAGSTGLVANHLFCYNADHTADCGLQHAQQCDENIEDRDVSVSSVELEASSACACDSPLVAEGLNESECDRIFKFSSSGSRGGTGSPLKSMNLRKKSRARSGGLKKGAGDEKVEEGREVDFQQRSGRRYAVFLKRRRIIKNLTAGKSGSCSSKDGSLFGWGLGVGILYMMSAGKAEISRLNSAMDETAKVIQDLKTELYRRKYSSSMKPIEVNRNSEAITSKHVQPELEWSIALNKGPNNAKFSILPMCDAEYESSSVVTEDREPETHEMIRLEEELESELKKLPWCTSEASYQDAVVKEFYEGQECEPSHANQLQGVVPIELNQKLCHLLIEQQENQIVGLESELYLSQTKLREKETELHALKDCVKRLTEFSLSTVSDDESETEAHLDAKHTDDVEHSDKMNCESNKSFVGMKRPIDSTHVVIM